MRNSILLRMRNFAGLLSELTDGQEMFCVHRHHNGALQNAGQGCAPTPGQRLAAAQ